MGSSQGIEGTVNLELAEHSSLGGRSDVAEVALAWFMAMPEAATVIDERGCVVVANAAARRVLPDAVCSGALPLGDALAAPPNARDRCPIARAIESCAPARGARVMPTPGRQDRILNVSATPLKLSGGRRAAGVLLADETVRHEIDRARGDFFSALAHDLRTPLTVILGHANFLQSLLPNRGDRVEKSVASIMDSARRVNEMISGLVELGRLRTVQPRLQRELLRVDDLVRVLADRLNATTTSLRITVDVDADVPPVRFDPDLIERVTSNLLTNALKYSPDGAAVLVRITGDDAYVTVEVHDQGIGMTPEEIACVFEAFYRSEQARAYGKGFGLGLHISKSFVEAHGGRIWVESEPGRGSKFAFCLPIGVASNVSTR